MNLLKSLRRNSLVAMVVLIGMVIIFYANTSAPYGQSLNETLQARESPIVTTISSTTACHITGDKVVAPSQIQLGDQATITISLLSSCEGLSTQLADIMIVIDRSGSMTYDNKMVAAKAAAVKFVEHLDPTLVRLGLLTFTGEVEMRVRLTNELGVIRAAIERLTPIGDTDMAGGLDAAGQELVSSEPSRRKILILLADGQQDGVPGDPVAVATNLKRLGIEIFAIGVGEDADIDSLKIIATDESHYYYAPTASELDMIYQQLGGRVLPDPPSNVQIDDEMGADIQFLPSTANPVAKESSTSLHWNKSSVTSDGILLSYTIVPQKVGVLPTNRRAVVKYESPQGTQHTLDLPIPRIEVIAPTETAVPTETRTPSPSYTAEPSKTRTPGPSSTVSRVTSTPSKSAPTSVGTVLRSLFLPIAIAEECPSKERFTDVVMVIDASTSMLQLVDGSLSKLDIAKDATRVFYGGLRLRKNGDRAAIVAFNDSAEVVQELTSELSLLEAALERVSVRPKSRLDLGLALASVRLSSRGDRTQAIVLLSDGKINQSAPSSAIAAANMARATGVEVYVVGFGPDLDEGTLKSIAGSANYYVPVPDPKLLVRVYRRLVRQVSCSPSIYWSRR